MKNKALFLDRDGVVNADRNYVFRAEDFEFIDGIFEFCRYFQDRGYLLIIITNQAGIARGYYNASDFMKLTDWMTARFKENGVTVTKTYFCPHHPEITGPCDCRKPNPGMILQAVKEFSVNPEESILIGNSESDLEAGENAGIGKNFLFRDSADFHRIISIYAK